MLNDSIKKLDYVFDTKKLTIESYRDGIKATVRWLARPEQKEVLLVDELNSDGYFLPLETNDFFLAGHLYQMLGTSEEVAKAPRSLFFSTTESSSIPKPTHTLGPGNYVTATS